MAEKPLMLKDYLELEYISESFRWASLQRIRPSGGSGITVRQLLETEFGSGRSENSGWRLVRFQSKGVLTKLSAFIKILQFFADEPSPSAPEGGRRGERKPSSSRILYRSFSKKLKSGFLKKRGIEKGGGKVMAKEELVCGNHFHSSPSFNKCRSSSGLFTSGRHMSTPRIPEFGLSPRLIPSHQNVILLDGGSGGGDSGGNQREQKEQCGKGMDCPSEEEKEQLSPVSILDFPYPEEEEDEEEDEDVEQLSSTSPPCFEKSIANIERTKKKLLQSIRRLENLADLDLDQLFTCSEAHAESTVHVETKEERCQRTACSLLRRLDCGGSLLAYGEKLLFDYFVESLSLNEDCQQGMTNGRNGYEELLQEADEWLAGARVTAEPDWEMGFRETERGCVGWRRFEGEEKVVAAGISGVLLTWLMAELVDDLSSVN